MATNLERIGIIGVGRMGLPMVKLMRNVSKMADAAGLSLPITGAVKELVKEARRIKASNPPQWTKR